MQRPAEDSNDFSTVQGHRDYHDPDLDFAGGFKVAQTQANNIHSDIERILSFVISTFLRPRRKEDLPDWLASYTQDRQYLYVMITIWYLVRHLCPEEPPGPERPAFQKICQIPEMKTWAMPKSWLYHILPLENQRFETDMEGEVLLLKWFHYGSIWHLTSQNRTILSQSWQEDGLLHRVHGLRRVAKMSLAAKISSKRPYLPCDEIVDRLAFLADELDLEWYHVPMSSLATRRIRQRDYTTSVNPGRLDKGQDGNIHGPWEIYALSHHSRLMLSNAEAVAPGDHGTQQRVEEVEKYRKKFSKFLTTEASLISCWDRTNMITRRGWLRSETTCVLASTLLDIYQKDMAQLSSNPASETQDKNPKSSKDHNRLEWHEELGTLKAENSKLMKQLTDGNEPPPIDWTIYRPPRRYHPEDFFRSLGDTSHRYHSAQTHDTRIPISLQTLLSGWEPKLAESGRWTVADLRKIENLSNLSVIDIYATDSLRHIDGKANEQPNERDGSRMRRIKMFGWLAERQDSNGNACSLSSEERVENLLQPLFQSVRKLDYCLYCDI